MRIRCLALLCLSKCCLNEAIKTYNNDNYFTMFNTSLIPADYLTINRLIFLPELLTVCNNFRYGMPKSLLTRATPE